MQQPGGLLNEQLVHLLEEQPAHLLVVSDELELEQEQDLDTVTLN